MLRVHQSLSIMQHRSLLNTHELVHRTDLVSPKTVGSIRYAAYPAVLNHYTARGSHIHGLGSAIHSSTAIPTTIRYTAKGTNPLCLTHAMNHATAA